jgi:hypothetical protein
MLIIASAASQEVEPHIRHSQCKQYGSVKGRDAIYRRQDKGMIIVKTAIYRVFVIYNFHQKTLSELYCQWKTGNETH